MAYRHDGCGLPALRLSPHRPSPEPSIARGINLSTARAARWVTYPYRRHQPWRGRFVPTGPTLYSYLERADRDAVAVNLMAMPSMDLDVNPNGSVLAI